MGLGSCYSTLKYLVVIINVIFWVTGLAIVGISLWSLIDPHVFIGVAQNEASYNSGFYILLAVGLLLLVAGLLGCCGAIKESQCLLISFFCILLVVVVAEIAAGVWAFLNQDKLEELVDSNIKITVKEEYGSIESRTALFDTIQTQLQCCGANGPGDWAGSKFNQQEEKLDISIRSNAKNYIIPASCCKNINQDPECKNGLKTILSVPIPSSVYSEGCISKLYEYLRTYATVIIGIVLGVAICEFLGLILSLILCCAVRFVDRYKA